jgi:uncharacterized membrane protein YcaP (DUF421 family)
MFDNIFFGEVALATGVTGITTIILVHMLVVYAAFISARIDRLLGDRPIQVVQQGSMIREALGKTRVRPETITSLVRLHGEDRLDEVEEANIEPDGQLSLRRREAAKPAQKRDLPALERLLR